MGEVIQLNGIGCDVEIKRKPVEGLRGYTLWMISSDDSEKARRAACAIVGAPGVKFYSMSNPLFVPAQTNCYVVTGYTVDDIFATLEKEK